MILYVTTSSGIRAFNINGERLLRDHKAGLWQSEESKYPKSRVLSSVLHHNLELWPVDTDIANICEYQGQFFAQHLIKRSHFQPSAIF